MSAGPASPGAVAEGPSAVWRTLPSDWAAWWLDRGHELDAPSDAGSAPPTTLWHPARGQSLLSRRLRRRAGGRAAAWPGADADPRWAGLIGIPPPALARACRLLAGVWLGVAGPDWARWPVERRRWALGLASTASFHALCPDLRVRLAHEPDRAAAWAWHELRPRMEMGCRGLWSRARQAWPDGEPPGASAGPWGAGDPGPLPATTPADAARVLRLWRACLQVVAEDAAAGAADSQPGAGAAPGPVRP